MVTDDELTLGGRLRTGDADAFTAIFTRYFPALCVFAIRFTGSRSAAEEVVEDVFVRLWEQRERLDVRTSLKNYLYTAVHNRALNFSRNERKAAEMLGALAPDVAPPGMAEPRAAADDEVHLADLSRALADAVADRPPRTREIFTMHRGGGMTCREIAAALSIRPKTVEKLLGRALKHLRKRLAPFLAR